MRLKTFRGRDLAAVCTEARAVFGEDALVVATRTLDDGVRPWIEVEATGAADLAQLKSLVTATPEHIRARKARTSTSARIVALVGPTGAGKTTTIAKLAVNPDAFGSSRVGLLTFDTYRAGAFEQLEAYAEAAGLPCQIVYDATELAPAITRLGNCDVILVDTPGRGPRGAGTDAWRSLVNTLRPDEVHLVIPATTRFDLFSRLRTEYGSLGPTHGILTKLDEVPSDTRIARVVSNLGLPMRWITDGQSVPEDVHPAAPGILATLGVTTTLGAA